MKLARICIAIAALLAFASICAAQNTPASDTESKIIANEKMVVDAVSKNDSETFKKLVSMDAWVVNEHGVAKVSDVLQFIFDPNVKTTSYSVDEPKVIMLDSDTALITYKSAWAGTNNGKAESETTYDSTIWSKRDGKWVAIFHQATEVAKPPEKTPPGN